MHTDARARTAEANVSGLSFAMVIADPRIDDWPLTYVNQAFERLTLFNRGMALGRNCRFLQGEDTEPDAVQRIRDGLAAREDFTVTLVNYRADGSAFCNRLALSPLEAPSGELVGYLGIQREVDAIDTPNTDPVERNASAALIEIQHRVKNHLSMIVSLIRQQSRRELTPASFDALARRVECLALLYDALSGQGVCATEDGQVAAGAYISRVAAVLGTLESREAIRLNIECEEIDLPLEKAARLGLIVSELMTNALQHAFPDRAAGLVEVRLTRLTGDGLRLTVQDDGVGLPNESDWPKSAESVERAQARSESENGELDTRGRHGRSGLGGSIVRALVESLDAKLSVTSETRGTICTLDL